MIESPCTAAFVRRVLTDRKKIFTHYLKGWFACDVISSIPWAMIAAGVDDASKLMFVQVSDLKPK
jgi:hypothetical protein